MMPAWVRAVGGELLARGHYPRACMWVHKQGPCEASEHNSYFMDRTTEVCKVQQKHRRK